MPAARNAGANAPGNPGNSPRRRQTAAAQAAATTVPPPPPATTVPPPPPPRGRQGGNPLSAIGTVAGVILLLVLLAALAWKFFPSGSTELEWQKEDRVLTNSNPKYPHHNTPPEVSSIKRVTYEGVGAIGIPENSAGKPVLSPLPPAVNLTGDLRGASWIHVDNDRSKMGMRLSKLDQKGKKEYPAKVWVLQLSN